MSRRSVAFVLLALAGMLAVPDPSFAAPGGFRGGGGFRAPVVLRQARPAITHHQREIIRPGAVQFRSPLPPRFAPGLARTTVRAPFVRLERRLHYRYVWPYVYPSTTDDNGYGYFGTPYDPAEGIPVYAPPSITDMDPPAPPALPRLSGTREENGEACRAERVTVPAAEGEREITVVRC
jgi:hypothetical protein